MLRKKSGVFGSYARGEQAGGSGLERLVDLAEPIVGLKEELESSWTLF
ncbi:hypothetical protein [Methanofollis fontis]|nr:hypothetical protein [Methanofollis fontis]